jgi:hypothetical protein
MQGESVKTQKEKQTRVSADVEVIRGKPMGSNRLPPAVCKERQRKHTQHDEQCTGHGMQPNQEAQRALSNHAGKGFI